MLLNNAACAGSGALLSCVMASEIVRFTLVSAKASECDERHRLRRTGAYLNRAIALIGDYHNAKRRIAVVAGAWQWW
jgi:hypothetical protein